MNWYLSRRQQHAVRVIIFLFLLSGSIMHSNLAIAAGALAVALPPDVPHQGFAIGVATDEPSDQAAAIALTHCRETTISGIRPLCKVIQGFQNQCVAFAMDPQPGAPGIGWGIADDLHSAEARALSKCEAIAGPGRHDTCVVGNFACDGTAK